MRSWIIVRRVDEIQTSAPLMFLQENETVQVAESAKEAMGDAIQTEEASQLSGEVEMLQVCKPPKPPLGSARSSHSPPVLF